MLRTALIAKRTDDGDPDTEEIRRLAEAAGASVAGTVTQTRPADPGTHFGTGKVEELAERVDETGADTVVVDADLSPRQTVTLEERVGARVVDRHRVVLEIFARQARTRRAQLQVELARLRYRLPRVRERADEGLLNRRTESGTPYYDLQDRIDALERKLAEGPGVDEQHRQARREAGFEVVALAGYTNAGKTTLLRRLADDMDLQTAGHDDLEETATVEDRLFATLETTTRRATVQGREVLVTDTVGFLEDLPHWLVESFRGTLGSVGAADAVVVVVDVAQPAGAIRRQLETTLETVPTDVAVVTALNKVDQVDDATLARRREALADRLERPVEISAREGSLDALESALLGVLEDHEQARFELPLTDDAMSLVSWLHDNASQVAVNYGSDTAIATVTARPETVRKATARARELE
jgi:GTP-binding protein HflX